MRFMAEDKKIDRNFQWCHDYRKLYLPYCTLIWKGCHFDKIMKSAFKQVWNTRQEKTVKFIFQKQSKCEFNVQKVRYVIFVILDNGKKTKIPIFWSLGIVQNSWVLDFVIFCKVDRKHAAESWMKKLKNRQKSLTQECQILPKMAPDLAKFGRSSKKSACIWHFVCSRLTKISQILKKYAHITRISYQHPTFSAFRATY